MKAIASGIALVFVAAAIVVSVRASLGVSTWPGAQVAGAAEVATPAILTSDEADCAVTPRPFAEIAALAEAPAGQLRSFQLGTPGAEIATPVPPTGGIPADPAVIEAVSIALRDVYACLNGGDMLRATALWTDHYLRLGFGGLDVEILASLATPVVVPAIDRATLVAVEDVRVLDDGRVSALVQFDDRRAIHIFVVMADGRYLLDGGSDVTENGTPIP